MDDRKNKIVVGAVIIIVVVGVAAIALIRKGSPKCELTNTKPELADVNWDNLKNIADTNDYKTLAAFSGYLIYDTTDEKNITYLPLELEAVSFKSDVTPNLLTLNSSCATLVLSVTSDTKGVFVNSVEIDLVVPKGADNKCSIKEKLDWNAPPGEHYRSDKAKPKTYQLHTSSDQRLDLVVSKLEFEINGSPDDIKAGKYTTKPTVPPKV